MADPGNTEIQIQNGGVNPERGLEYTGEQEIRDYIKKIIVVAKDRFFDKGQSATIALAQPSYVPGYVSLVAITNPEQDMDVVVSQYNGLSGDRGVTSEDIGGQEIHIAYRQLKGSRSVPKPIRRKLNGYDFGGVVLPSEGSGKHQIKKPHSSKSTMRVIDVKKWEEGDVFPAGHIGYMEGQKKLQPTKADYEAILDTVVRGSKNQALTIAAIQTLPKITYATKWREKSLTEAQADLERRNLEIMRGEKLAVDSTDIKLLEQASTPETDHSNDQSFDIAEQRLRELALQYPGQDAMVIDYVADQLRAFGRTLNIVRTMLESDDPKVKEVIKNVRTDKSEALSTPDEMFYLTKFIAANPDFEIMRQNIGFIREIEYGISIDHMFTGHDHGDVNNQVEASQEVKMKILEALEFLRPSEALGERMDRIGGQPMYAITRSGEETGQLSTFRQNPRNGESIIWNPYYASTIHHFEKLPNIRITSPLFGPYLITMVDVDLGIVNDGKKDRLQPKTGKIDWITLRFEGGTTENQAEEEGGAMMRLSKKI